MGRTVGTDYLVVGAGAAGMAFVDALVQHAPGVHVTLVDRRAGVGGHWLDAYPFVRLHQASQLYGVASTRLGDGTVQTSGPETGLHERATGAQVRDYYNAVLTDRLLPTERVEVRIGHEYRDGRLVDVSTGHEVELDVRRYVVDARYLASSTPARTPAPFAVEQGARVVPVGDLPDTEAERFVVAGSGKTATDAVVWLLGQGVAPDAITWVRPREPWMFDRAVIQPDPAVFLSMAATLMATAASASSADDLFLHLEDAGIMVRIDRSVTPTMARTPTLGRWELSLLRSVARVIRQGHLRRVAPGRLVLDTGEVSVPKDAVVVHCAAYGLPKRPSLPIWGRRLTLQPTRSGFPCFSAALVGYVEATRPHRSPAEKNRLCRATSYWNTPVEWAAVQSAGARAAATFMAEPDVAQWAHSVLLNPARVPTGAEARPEVFAAVDRYREHAAEGIEGLARLGALTP